MIIQVIPRQFYKRDTVLVSRELLGKKLVRVIDSTILVGIISETESYRNDDPASHSFIGETERNKSMFGEVGHAYVYISYGIHFCLNAVARDTDKFKAGGALIRSIIPIKNVDIMIKNRNLEDKIRLC